MAQIITPSLAKRSKGESKYIKNNYSKARKAYTDRGKTDKKKETTTEKEYKSCYPSKQTIDLVNKVTLTKKIQEIKYSHDDAICDPFGIFAKEQGITI